MEFTVEFAVLVVGAAFEGGVIFDLTFSIEACVIVSVVASDFGLPCVAIVGLVVCANAGSAFFVGCVGTAFDLKSVDRAPLDIALARSASLRVHRKASVGAGALAVVGALGGSAFKSAAFAGVFDIGVGSEALGKAA